jgi:hypothetical protein
MGHDYPFVDAREYSHLGTISQQFSGCDLSGVLTPLRRGDLGDNYRRETITFRPTTIGCSGCGIYCLLPFKSDKSFSSISPRLRGAFPQDVR